MLNHFCPNRREWSDHGTEKRNTRQTGHKRYGYEQPIGFLPNHERQQRAHETLSDSLSRKGHQPTQGTLRLRRLESQRRNSHGRLKIHALRGTQIVALSPQKQPKSSPATLNSDYSFLPSRLLLFTPLITRFYPLSSFKFFQYKEKFLP